MFHSEDIRHYPFDRRSQSALMSKVKNGGLVQYGAKPFEQQQFGTAAVEGVKSRGRRKTEKM